MTRRTLKEIELDLVIQKEQQSLFRYACYKIGDTEDAADILQDYFFRIYSKPINMLSIDKLQSYLYRSVSNACNTYYRLKTHKNFIPIEKLKDISDEPDDDFSEEYLRISKILSHIPKEQAEVIRLRIICEKSFVEIAKILLIPVTTVKSRFKYGIDKIRSDFFNSSDV
jgi:RNA polymerase sigma factor, sigma-70 family